MTGCGCQMLRGGARQNPSLPGTTPAVAGLRTTSEDLVAVRATGAKRLYPGAVDMPSGCAHWKGGRSPKPRTLRSAKVL